jgi:hypothetical protein
LTPFSLSTRCVPSASLRSGVAKAHRWTMTTPRVESVAFFVGTATKDWVASQTTRPASKQRWSTCAASSG